ncbi:hypothetical protein HAX54_049965, partial [Datura stramonium]|nr:hypothetical protein [Datura stramonium]
DSSVRAQNSPDNNVRVPEALVPKSPSWYIRGRICRSYSNTHIVSCCPVRPQGSAPNSYSSPDSEGASRIREFLRMNPLVFIGTK